MIERGQDEMARAAFGFVAVTRGQWSTLLDLGDTDSLLPVDSMLLAENTGGQAASATRG
jgi:hypothetical protein